VRVDIQALGHQCHVLLVPGREGLGSLNTIRVG
jgi:hypothetical protein